MKSIIYGPVPSRRLGISLGVDIIPYKTCCYDCVYCQLGKTTFQILKRKSYVHPSSVLKEIKGVLTQNPDIDYVTFSGSGEPTLNKDIGKMIGKIKELTKIPVAVLTNASLLWNKNVRRDLSKADLVVPSLDAVSDKAFKKVNRPAKGLKIKKVLDGLKTFTQEFKGKIQLEIMLVKNLNDSEEEIERISQFVKKLTIDKIQLNTVIRPPSEPEAKSVDAEKLKKIKRFFEKNHEVEIISDFKRKTKKAYHRDLENAILALLKRRPAKKDEMAISLGVHTNEILKHLHILEQEKKIKRLKAKGSKDFFFVKS